MYLFVRNASLVNSAIVKLAKLVIFCIYIVYIITRYQIFSKDCYSIYVQNIASLAVAMVLLCWLLGKKI